MKIVTYLLAAFLVAALGAAALFYFSTFEPMLADYTRMKQGLPEFDKAKAELKKYKEKEAKEAGKTAWLPPALDALNAGLIEEIKTGKVEISNAGDGIVINISEEILYTPRSVTFAGKEAQPLLQKLAAALANKDLKGKMIIVGNTTDAVPAQGKGRKKIPPKEARTLAADRSLQLVRNLEQNKVDSEMLVAAGYPAKLHDTGFKIKDHKTIILIENLPAPAVAADQSKQTTQAPQAAPKTIPLKPAQPSGQ